MTDSIKSLLIFSSIFILITSCDPNESEVIEYNVFIEYPSATLVNGVVLETTPKASNKDSHRIEIGEQETLTFNDGTKVTLFVNTDQAYSETFEGRFEFDSFRW